MLLLETAGRAVGVAVRPTVAGGAATGVGTVVGVAVFAGRAVAAGGIVVAVAAVVGVAGATKDTGVGVPETPLHPDATASSRTAARLA